MPFDRDLGVLCPMRYLVRLQWLAGVSAWCQLGEVTRLSIRCSTYSAMPKLDVKTVAKQTKVSFYFEPNQWLNTHTGRIL